MKFAYPLLIVLLASSDAWAQGPAPSPQHEVLKQDIGVWQASCKAYIPQAPTPLEFTGTETCRMIGEFWSFGEFKSSIQGQTFEGIGLVGFNPKTKQFEGSWHDSMTPFISQMAGSYDEKTKTMTFKTKSVDPATGEEKAGKSVMKYDGENTRVYTMFDIVDGKEVKTMEIQYTRK